MEIFTVPFPCHAHQATSQPPSHAHRTGIKKNLNPTTGKNKSNLVMDRLSTSPALLFAINLGQDDSNLAIHLNARFEALGDVKQTVCNSRSNGQWGAEVRPSIFPFQEGAEIKIKVKIDGQEISFPNRLGLNSVRYLSVDGDMTSFSWEKCVIVAVFPF
uniref:Galectin n=1 Tax=Naja naja TaxID=35670 RepID=A0A8C6VDY5_NAJNA